MRKPHRNRQKESENKTANTGEGRRDGGKHRKNENEGKRSTSIYITKNIRTYIYIKKENKKTKSAKKTNEQ